MPVLKAEHFLSETRRMLSLSHVYIESLAGGYTDPVDMTLVSRCLLQSGIDVDEPEARALKAYLLRQQEERPDLTGMAILF